MSKSNCRRKSTADFALPRAERLRCRRGTLNGSVALLGLLSLLTGCGSPANQPVDPEIARATLVRTLEHWQQGGAATDCQAWNPPVVVGHSPWQDGAKLSGFKLTAERSLDANLFVNVEMQLSQGGRTETMMEQYCVSTDPVLTVFRTMQPAF